MRVYLIATISFVLSGVTATLGGCTFHADYQDTEYRCAQAAECPTGQVCLSGLCTPAVDIDAPCGTTALAAFDFAVADLDALDTNTWWFFDNGHDDGEAPYISFPDERLSVSIPAADGGVGAGLGSKTFFPLANAGIDIELIEVPLDPDGEVYVGLGDRDNQYLSWAIIAGVLYAQYYDGSNTLDLGELPYDPMVTRWLRLREQDGRIIWEASPDHELWSEYATMTNPAFGDWVFVDVELWKNSTTDEPLVFVADNLNGGAAPDMRFCPLELLRDDFDDGEMAGQWRTVSSGETCDYSESEGRLDFGFPDMGYTECTYFSQTLYDMSQSAVTIEAPLEDVALVEQEIWLEMPDGDRVEFELTDGSLRGEREIDGSDDVLFDVPFDPVMHRHWRMRGEGTTLHWETSPDRLEWTTLGTHISPPLPLDRVYLAISGDTSDGMVETFGLGFDDLNIE